MGVKEARINFAKKRERIIDERFAWLAEEVRRIKADSVERIRELVETAEKNFERRGIEFYFARDAREATEISADFLEGCESAVRSKSLVGHEVGLSEHLERIGISVSETDLGDVIVSLFREHPRHFTMPAIHISAEMVLERFGVDDIDELRKRVREDVRRKIISADAGITGANVISSDGSVLIIENEGNVRLVSSIPERHLVITGVEKIVGSFDEAVRVAELTWRSAGYEMPSYLNVIGGPSKSGDVEKKLIVGLHGPERVAVVVVDNGRIRASKTEFREALYCLRCGACLFSCPSYASLNAEWGGVYPGGIGQVWNYIIERTANPFYCLHCDACREVCPLNINTSEMLLKIKFVLNEKIRKF